MLNKLTVHGFKSIERQTIALGALNILIGANGSGKSNLLVALSFFKNSVLGKPDVLVKQLGGADRLLFHGKKLRRNEQIIRLEWKQEILMPILMQIRCLMAPRGALAQCTSG